MTKLKEKMMQWRRYVETIEQLMVVLVLIGIIGVIIGFIKYDTQWLWGYILCIISGVLGIFAEMIKCISRHNKEFVQKNSFWNIVLADEQVIILFIIWFFAFSIVLTDFVSEKFLILEIIILFIRFLEVQKITDFFKKRLIE